MAHPFGLIGVSMTERCVVSSERYAIDDHTAPRCADLPGVRLYRYAQGCIDPGHAGAAVIGARSIRAWGGVCLSRSPGRHDQSSMARRHRGMPVDQAIRTWTVYLADVGGGNGITEFGSAQYTARSCMLMPLLVRLTDSEVEVADGVVP